MGLRGLRAALVALAALIGTVVAQGPGRADPSVVPTHGFMGLVGSMHEHSGYSDGYPGSTPASYYASAKHFGLDFLASGEHSDNAKIPVVASDYCIGAEILSCVGGDPQHPLRALHKWSATQRYAREATTADFVGLRGFEWTSDRFGHINVYFSKRDTNAKADGGYAVMDTFYAWLTRVPALLGGADGLATFNHPGDKSLLDGDAAFNWNDFAYHPEADDHMVGIELYNTRSEYGTFHDATDPAEGYYAHALDKGWHLGAVGAEDLGHKKGDDWGGPGWAKTVMLATTRSAAAIRDAMAARRFYAVQDGTIRLDFTVDGALMGSRLHKPAGTPLAIHGSTNRAGATIEVVTSGGLTVASGGGGTLDTSLPSATNQRYYFIRIRDAGGEPVAYSSPIWIAA
jgi:hypothetical protein